MRRAPGGQWSVPTKLETTEPAYLPDVALDDRGRAIVTYGSAPGLWSCRFNRDGEWETPRFVKAGGGLPVRIGVDANGNAVAVWSESLPPPDGRWTIWASSFR